MKISQEITEIIGLVINLLLVLVFLLTLLFKIKEDVGIKIEVPKEITVISTRKDINSLMSTLNKYVEKDVIAVGKKEYFQITPNSEMFTIVVDTNQIYGFYKFENNEFINIRSKEKVTDLRLKYPDTRRIWIQYFHKYEDSFDE